MRGGVGWGRGCWFSKLFFYFVKMVYMVFAILYQQYWRRGKLDIKLCPHIIHVCGRNIADAITELRYQYNNSCILFSHFPKYVTKYM